MRLTFVLGIVLATLLGGCAGSGVVKQTQASPPAVAVTAPAAAPAPTATAHVACERQQQPGCFELRALSFRWDARNQLLRGLDKPYASQAERQRRVQTLGPTLWEGYRAGKLQAAAPKSYIVMMWNVSAVPAGNMAAYRVNGASHVVTKVAVEDVTGTTKVPVFDTSVSTLGNPQRVYRIRTDGTDAVGTSIQFPWSMVTDTTVILVCPENSESVYPGGKPGKGNGLWVTTADVGWLKGKGSTRGLLPFVLSK